MASEFDRPTPNPLAEFPLPDPTGDSLGVSPATIERWCRWFIVLGVAARCIRYLLRFPLWEDECFLCYNYLDRDFAGLTEKLDYSPQVAPVFYLWVQLALVKLLGFNEWTLRLTSFLGGVCGVFLFNRLSKVFLTGLPRLFAVGLFCVSYVCIRYSAEAKPYGLDLFFGMVMAFLLVRWLQSGRGRDLALLAIATPLMAGSSFTIFFVGGGLILFAAWVLWRERMTPRWWVGLGTFTVVLMVSFVAAYRLNISQKMSTDLGGMHFYWGRSFPPITQPLKIPMFLFRAHASELTPYPAGGPVYSSSLSFLVWIVAMVALVRRRQWSFLVLCLGPLAVTFVAAALKKYPYGGHFKFNHYLALTMCMTLGYGVAIAAAATARAMKGWMNGWMTGPRVTAAVAGGIAVAALVTAAMDLTAPYKSLGDHYNRSFAQWFWPEQELGSEVVCMKRDLKLDLCPIEHQMLNYSAVYMCNQAIYSHRRKPGQAVAWDRVSEVRPLTCVMYRDPMLPFDDAKLQTWLREMNRNYRLVGRSQLPQLRKEHTERYLVSLAYVEVFRFTPLPTGVAAR